MARMKHDPGSTKGSTAEAADPAKAGATGRRRRGPWRDLSDRFVTVAVLAGLFGLWQLASLVAGSSSVSGEPLIPDIRQVVRSFDSLAYYGQGGLGMAPASEGGPVNFPAAVLSLAQNTWPTLIRLALGLIVGLIAAGLLGVIVSWSSVLRRMLWLPAHAARMLPLMALFPLFALWFGNAESGVVLFVAFGTFSLMFILTVTAISNVPSYYFDCARSLGAGRLRAYLTVVLPASLPNLRGGVMLSLGFGWSMVIAAEFIGQKVGLGRIVILATDAGKVGILAVVAVFVVIYAAISSYLVTRGFNYLVRWSE
jgi:sulfonate transport system permease protein